MGLCFGCRSQGSTGQPSSPIVGLNLNPNCSAVRTRWQSAQRQRILSSVSVPPFSSGTMWSGTVAALIRPLALQSRQSGSAVSRRLRCATPRRPRSRSVLGHRSLRATKHPLDQHLMLVHIWKHKARAVLLLIDLERSINCLCWNRTATARACHRSEPACFIDVTASAGHGKGWLDQRRPPLAFGERLSEFLMA